MPYRPARRDRPARLRLGAARSGPTLALCAVALFGSLFAPGCAALRQKWDAAVATDIDNPALPPKPIRVPGARTTAELTPEGPATEIKLVDAEEDAPPHFDDADIVATVNGEPLLAGDLLQFEVQLKSATEQILNAPSPDEVPPGDPRGLNPKQRAYLLTKIDAERARLLAERLPAKIEEALLAQRMRRTLKSEQLERLNGSAATLFDQSELPQMLKKANAQAAAAGQPPIESKEELRRLMAKQGLDLDAVVAAWKPQQMAMAYVEQKTGMESIRISRQEVRDYYDAHQEDFTPAKAARWEQIKIPYADEDGKPAALDVVEAAAGDLRRGRPFAAVAEQHSAGPRAAEGGRWDWTAPTAIPNQRVSAAVWEQPIGEVGAVFDCPLSPNGFPPGGAYYIVRVLERRGDGPPPLDELQERIESLIKGERRQQAVADLLAQERAAAQIEVYVPETKWPPER